MARLLTINFTSPDDVTVEQIRAVLVKFPMTKASTITVGPREKVREPK